MRAHGSASSSSTPWYGPFISADARVRQKVPNPHPVHCLLRELHGLEAVVGQNVPLVQDLGGRGKPARESQQRWERTDTLARGRGGQGLSAAASSRSLPLLLVPQGGGRPRGRPSCPRQSSAAAGWAAGLSGPRLGRSCWQVNKTYAALTSQMDAESRFCATLCDWKLSTLRFRSVCAACLHAIFRSGLRFPQNRCLSNEEGHRAGGLSRGC